MRLDELRRAYHEKLCKHLIRIRRNKEKGDYPNNADGDGKRLRDISDLPFDLAA